MSKKSTEDTLEPPARFDKADLAKLRRITDKCVPIRQEINQVMYAEMRELAKAFLQATDPNPLESEIPNTGELVNTRPNAMFKMAVDALHYIGGGYPSPTSRGVMESRLHYIGLVKYLLTKAGLQSRMDKLLAAHGIRSIDIDVKWFDDRLGDKMARVDPKVLRHIFKSGDDVQGRICNAANRIKIDAFGALPAGILHVPQNPSGLKKSQFQKLVSAKAAADPDKSKIATRKGAGREITNKASFRRLLNKV